MEKTNKTLALLVAGVVVLAVVGITLADGWHMQPAEPDTLDESAIVDDQAAGETADNIADSTPASDDQAGSETADDAATAE